MPDGYNADECVVRKRTEYSLVERRGQLGFNRRQRAIFLFFVA